MLPRFVAVSHGYYKQNVPTNYIFMLNISLVAGGRLRACTCKMIITETLDARRAIECERAQLVVYKQECIFLY